MRRIFTLKKLFVTGMLLSAGANLFAEVERPPLPTQTLTSGEKYVMFNYARPDGYMSRTSWDGALYLLGPDDSAYANHQLEAEQNEDGTWLFKQVTPSQVEGGEPTVNYMILPSGSGNVNLKPDSAVWHVKPGSQEGYYWLKPGEGNNVSILEQDCYHIHLNAGQQYVVASYHGDSWYPDFALKTDADTTVYEYINVGAQLYQIWHMADSTSLNWGFVNVDDVPLYTATYNAWKALNDYELTYLGLEGYENGFQNGYDAALAIYNNGVTSQDIAEAIVAILEEKIALYNEIENAIYLNEEGDAVLENAIEAAFAVFDTSVDAAELAAACEALKVAEENFKQGLGDYTGKGVNMSFEDLSAQNGNVTTGVAAPPVGWTLILNGDTVTTVDEIRAHGVANWCGVNADCAGETKDGNYGFGIWTSGFPTVQLSQTIEGLENGTYVVNAALMVGANNNGSRRTTQRIFANLNSTYYGSESEYDLNLLDNSEVYAFAEHMEPVTDTDMYPVSVRAYVYDGTLTIGLRTDNNIAAALRSTSNSAGGDGWFKVDNFTITKEAYIAEDAVAILEYYLNLIYDYSSADYLKYEGTQEMLDEELEKYEDITVESSQEDINAAILGARELLIVAREAVQAYERLGDAIMKAYENYETYLDFPGSEEYGDIISDIESNYEDGLYTEAEIDGVIAQLDEALENCKKSEILVGKYITYILRNPSFEDMSSQPTGDSGGVANAPAGWDLIIDGDTCRTVADINTVASLGWCAINSGDPIGVTLEDGTYVEKQPTDGDKLWGIWAETLPEVELSQTLTGLPMGTYVLTVDVGVQNNWANDNITTQRIFANSYVQMFASEEAHSLNLPEDAQEAAERDAAYPDASVPFLTYADYTCETGDRLTDLLHTMTVTFGVDDSGIAKIGFRTNDVNIHGYSREVGDTDETGENTRGQGWFKLDNFTLYYLSEELPTSIESLENLEAVTVVARQYFNADGVKVSVPQRGVNIVKTILEDGSVKVTKMLVK